MYRNWQQETIWANLLSWPWCVIAVQRIQWNPQSSPLKCHYTATVYMERVHWCICMLPLLYTLKFIHRNQTLYLPYTPMHSRKSCSHYKIDLNLWLAFRKFPHSMLFLHVLVSGFPGPSIQHNINSPLHPCFYGNRCVLYYTVIHHSQVLCTGNGLVDYSSCFLCSLRNSGNFISKEGCKHVLRTPNYRFTNVWRG